MAWDVVGLGVFAAVLWGVANYFGGVVSRDVGAQRGALGIQVATFLMITPLALIVPGNWSASVLAWGVLASFAGVIGFVAMYAGMATGSMGVVTKLLSATMILVPLAVGLAQGERPSAIELGGVLLVTSSILVLSRQPRTQSAHHTNTDRRAVVLGLVSGVGFGLAVSASGQTGVGDGAVVLVPYRAMIALMLWSYLRARRERVSIPSRVWKVIGVTGLLSAVGDTAFIVALQRGTLAVVPAIVALHPGVTALVARYWGHEQIRRVQVLGIVIGLTGIAIIKL